MRAETSCCHSPETIRTMTVILAALQATAETAEDDEGEGEEQRIYYPKAKTLKVSLEIGLQFKENYVEGM